MNRSRAFTLIEVLVVVAIIALLLAILMPSLSRVRQQSISATCLSSHHQIGVALTMYANRNRGYLPPQNTDLIEWVPDPTRLAFEKELGRNNYHKVLFCPNDDIMRDPEVEKRPPWPPGHVYGTTVYRIGYYYLGNPTWRNPANPSDASPSADVMWLDVNRNGKNRDEYICKIDEKNAEQVVVMTCRIIPQGPREGWLFRHPLDDKKGWSNVSCGDGHAEVRTHSKVKVRWHSPYPVGW
ncbi:MAG TPA: prepilin-type N-terminal cleavage/methylation domain-containing protein [Phycisphaerae bacterium]|nr:prepilin-type N-terminal cleavage/methylation domain-containing protein [Phycisphaerae bacterium]HRY70214.1 prepilin-type N-terminal cleavage/methylation domain-containing protein [Phycisphaerae bacterium]HSA27429.1 prepilin-type N-terminal cleavage/methylation domain-containing protein [Phycisphaerae bacterium]